MPLLLLCIFFVFSAERKNMKKTDFAIIGAGVVGGMIARELSRYQNSILIIEKENDVARGSSAANSAIVHAGFDAKPGSLKARLNVAGSRMMEQTAKQLGVKYRKNGSLVVGFSEEDHATLLELKKRGEENGVEGLRMLEREELLTLEPNIGDTVTTALYAPTGAIVCPYELTISAVGSAMDNGAELMLDTTLLGIEKQEDGFLLHTDREDIKAGAVINCAGLYADRVAAMVGDTRFHIHPRRGEYILLDRECGELCNTTIFRTPSALGKGILVSPTVDGNLLLGPTAEEMEDKEDKDTTREGLAAVTAQAKERLKGIPFNKAITSFAGLRAVGSTGDFIIDSPLPGFFNAAGIESPGLSSAPAIALYMIELIKEGGFVLEPKEDFQAERTLPHAFRELTQQEKNKVIAKDPSFGRMVCRCEEVSEGEILTAIRQNPPARDLDGIKRRTRAQMGRCQGGFCSPTVLTLLAKEWGVEPTEVTKSGKGSAVLLDKCKKV